MKTLVLVRHAKSSWDNPSVSDEDRPLNDRGRRDAVSLGQCFRREGLLADRVVCSTALRARQTAATALQAADWSCSVLADPNLYLAPASAYIAVAKQKGLDAATLVLVGHNPGISEAASILTGQPRDMKTGSIVRIDFEVERWELLEATTEVAGRWDWAPKDVKNSVAR